MELNPNKSLEDNYKASSRIKHKKSSLLLATAKSQNKEIFIKIITKEIIAHDYDLFTRTNARN